jgi:hypothetical protein
MVPLLPLTMPEVLPDAWYARCILCSSQQKTQTCSIVPLPLLKLCACRDAPAASMRLWWCLRVAWTWRLVAARSARSQSHCASCRSVCRAMPRTMRRSSSGPRGRAPLAECLPGAHQAASPQASVRLPLGVTLCRQPQARCLPHQVRAELSAKRLVLQVSYGRVHAYMPAASALQKGL